MGTADPVPTREEDPLQARFALEQALRNEAPLTPEVRAELAELVMVTGGLVQAHWSNYRDLVARASAFDAIAIYWRALEAAYDAATGRPGPPGT